MIPTVHKPIKIFAKLNYYAITNHSYLLKAGP